jgi:hypothetical protein
VSLELHAVSASVERDKSKIACFMAVLSRLE